MDNKYIARPCKNCKVNDCVFKGHENDFEVCEDYTVTIGDMIKMLFPDVEVDEKSEDTVHLKDKWHNPLVFIQIPKDIWNAPYKKESEK